MKVILILAVSLMTSTSFAKSTKLFNLFRTNYYTEKTMQYALKYGSSCQLEASKPVSVYFVDTETGKFVSGFSSYNRDYFGPKIIEQGADYVEYTFKAFEEVSKMAGENYSIVASLKKKGKKCVATAKLYANGSLVTSRLSRIETEFILKWRPLVGDQPDGFKWIRLHGAKKICLIGDCP